MVVSRNGYLTQSEMEENARYIYNQFKNRGWSLNAICGMLGNMQTESTINPGIWQNLDEGNTALGFGLVQWTPMSKYKDWADGLNVDYKDIITQIERIDFETHSSVAWISTNEYPLTFLEFKVSNETPEYLAQAFLRNYERPQNQNQPIRSTQARAWYNFLNGTSSKEKPLFPTTQGLEISSSYGWRFHPIYLEDRFHYGIDISGNGFNHPVYATQNAKVIRIEESDQVGYGVRLQHTSDPFCSQYIHFKEPTHLRVGDVVRKGQQIGIMGSTGDSTGIHLDFQVALSPTSFYTIEGTIDPEIYLQMEFTNEGGEGSQVVEKNAFIHLALANTLYRMW